MPILAGLGALMNTLGRRSDGHWGYGGCHAAADFVVARVARGRTARQACRWTSKSLFQREPSEACTVPQPMLQSFSRTLKAAGIDDQRTATVRRCCEPLPPSVCGVRAARALEHASQR